MFFLLRVFIIVAVLFFLSPVRDDRAVTSLDGHRLPALTGGFWPFAARWWDAVPVPVREGIAADALARLSRPELPGSREPAERLRPERDPPSPPHRAGGAR